MINIILGKPGSGKSLYCTKAIIRALRDTKKNIVTNVPLRLEVLNEYLQRKYPSEDLQVPQRVRLMTDEELGEFWKIRGPVAFTEEFPDDLPPFKFEHNPLADAGVNAAMFQMAQQEYARALKKRDDAQLEWFKNLGDSKGNRGVIYFLDECHIKFNARDWASIGRGALHYLSQHRKLSDDVYPVTQSAGNLDKQFRSVAESFTVLRNEYTAQYGIFKGRGRFSWKSYHKEPDSGSQPFLWGSFQFDGEEKCYDTARGIGIQGIAAADIGRRAKGIPVVFMIPAIVIGLLACMFLPYWGFKRAMGKSTTPAAAVADAKEVQAQPPEQKKAQAPLIKATEEMDIPRKEDERESPKPVGYGYGGAGAFVILSDGTTVFADDVDDKGKRRLTAVDKRYVKLDGKIQPFQRKAAAPRPQVIQNKVAEQPRATAPPRQATIMGLPFPTARPVPPAVSNTR